MVELRSENRLPEDPSTHLNQFFATYKSPAEANEEELQAANVQLKAEIIALKE